MTMAEKVLARHAGRTQVEPGEIVSCRVDLAAVHDLFFSVGDHYPYVKRIKKVFDPDRVAVIIDHGVPAPSVGDAEGGVRAREFVREHGITHFFDVGNHGVIHQLLVEHRLALPGRLLAGGDSHTCAAGAMNCAARGLGPAEMLWVLCTGETWYQVYPTICYRLEGSLPPMVTGKDVFLYLAGRYGDAANRNVEFQGSGVASLSIPERQSIAVMCAEISAEFVMFPYDQCLAEYLGKAPAPDFTPVDSDKDANYEDVRELNLRDMIPYVALPNSVPGNCKPVEEVEGVEIHQALIGSCSNGRLEDLALAARILAGRKVAPGVRLIVTPASQAVLAAAAREGYLEALVDAGAVVTNPTCGACYGGHMGLIAAGERCLSTSTRNFKGRMGSPEGEVILASVATVAASAIEGKVTDPRRLFTRGQA